MCSGAEPADCRACVVPCLPAKILPPSICLPAPPCLAFIALPSFALPADLNDGIPGAIELLSKGSLPADFWDWKFGADFKWEKGEEGAATDGNNSNAAAAAAAPSQPSTAAAQQQQQPPQAGGNGNGGSSSSDEFGEVQKQVHSAVEHVHPPEAPFVAGVDLQIPFR
jgi:hypothetical protein